MGRQKKAHVTGIPFCGYLRCICNGDSVPKPLPEDFVLWTPLLRPVSSRKD